MSDLRPPLLSGWLPTDCRVCRRWGARVLCEFCTSRFCSTPLRCGRCALGLGGNSGPGLAEAAACTGEPAGEPLAAGRVCAACLREPPPWRAAVCAEDYAFPWNTLIGDFKFRSDVALAALLAERLAAALGRAASSTDVDLVLPVPLSTQRLQQRGFNQAWELTRRLARLFGLQAEAHLLQRPVDTAHQVELSLQDRARNLQGAFMVDPQARSNLLGRRVALVDDVMTTGATFRQATRTLLQAGAGSVDVWAVARTP